MRFVHKILLMPILALMLGLAVMYVSWFGSRENHRLLDRIQVDHRQRIDHLNQMEEAVLAIHGSLRDAVTTGNEDRLSEALVQADKFTRLLAQSEALLRSDPDALRDLGTSFAHYFVNASALTRSIVSGTPPDAVVGQAQQMRQQYDGVRAFLDNLLNDQIESMEGALDHAKSAQKRLQTLIVVSAFAALGILVVFTLIIVRSIVVPVRRITEATEALARGDIEQTLDYRSQDEMGRLANAYRSMIDAIRVRAEAARRIAAGSIDVDFTVESESDVLGQAMSAMVERVVEKAKAADQISHGNLDVEVPVSSKDDVLGRAMRSMVAGLRQDRERREEIAEELRGSAERLQLATRAGRVGIWEYEPASDVLHWDDLMCEMYGLDGVTAEDGLTRWRNRLHPEDIGKAQREFQAAMNTDDSPYDTVFRIVRANDQAVRYIRAAASVLRDHEGRAIRVIGVNWDVTARKQAEAEREEAQGLLEAAVAHSPAGILIADAPDVTIRVANNAAFGIRGGDPVMLTNIDVTQHATRWQVLRPDGLPHPSEQLPLSRAVLQGETTEAEEYIIVDEDGIRHWVIANAAPIRDSAGRIKAGIVVFNDISDRKQAEDALRESEDKFRSLIRVAPIGICVVRDREFLYVNDRLCEMLDRTPEDLMGKSTRVAYPSVEEFERVGRQLYPSLPEKGTEFVETTLLRADGQVLDVILAGTIIDRQSPSKGTTITILDITERKKAEAALRESEERFRKLADLLPVSVVELDPNGKHSFVNREGLRVYGGSLEEFLAIDLENAFVPEDRPKISAMIHQVLTGEYSAAQELAAVRKDGTRLPMLVSAAPIAQNGGVARVALVGVDISDRKAAEEALQSSESKYRSLVADLGEGVVVIDGNEQFTFANPAVERIFGVETGGLVGRNLAEFTSAEDFAMASRKTQERSLGRTDSYELKIRPAKGSPRHVTVTTSALTGPDGEFAGSLAIFRDMTETRELETQLRQTQKMEAIGTLAGGIAHDFNNILTAILGFSEMARGHAPEENNVRSYVDEVVVAGLRARDLVKQILTFSRQSETQRRPILLHVIIKETLKLIRAALPSTIEIDARIDSSCNPVLADPTQIHQVLMNLFTNARHAMRDGGGVLGVSLEEIDLRGNQSSSTLGLADGSYARLTVSDTGVGMDENTQNRMFEPFFTTKPAGEGTGMGLSTSHGIIAGHDGIIKVTSRVGSGSSFDVYLPTLEHDAPAEAHADDSDDLRGCERVLFVDDELQLCDLGKALLESFGYQVDCRTASTEALEVFRRRAGDFDLVITDQTMPQMTGYELARKMLEIREDIPIILMTGYSEAVTPEKASVLGIRGYVMKPFLATDMAKAIREACGCPEARGNRQP